MHRPRTATMIDMREMLDAVRKRLGRQIPLLEKVGDFSCFRGRVPADAVASAIATALVTAQPDGTLMLPQDRRIDSQEDAVDLLITAMLLVAAPYRDTETDDLAVVYVLTNVHAALHHAESEDLPAFARFRTEQLSKMLLNKLGTCGSEIELAALTESAKQLAADAKTNGGNVFFFWPSTMRQLALLRNHGTDATGQPIPAKICKEAFAVIHEAFDGDGTILRADAVIDQMIGTAKERVETRETEQEEFEDMFRVLLTDLGLPLTAPVTYLHACPSLNLAGLGRGCTINVYPGVVPGAITIAVMPSDAPLPPLGSFLQQLEERFGLGR